MGTKNTGTATDFQKQVTNVETNLEKLNDMGLIPTVEAREVLTQGGMDKAQELGVAPADAKAIIDAALAKFDAHTSQGDEGIDSQDDDSQDDDLEEAI